MTTQNARKLSKTRLDRTEAYREHRDEYLIEKIKENHCLPGTPYIHRSGEIRVPRVLYIESSLTPILNLHNGKRTPHWDELTDTFQLNLISLSLSRKRCLAFTANLHADWEKELINSGKCIRSETRKIFTKELKARLGFDPPNLFVVEATDGYGNRKDVHVHGIIVVEDPTQDELIRRALWSATGNGTGGRNRRSHGVEFQVMYDALGWADYIMKGLPWDDSRIGGRRISFSHSAVKEGREVYNRITGRELAPLSVCATYRRLPWNQRGSPTRIPGTPYRSIHKLDLFLSLPSQIESVERHFHVH